MINLLMNEVVPFHHLISLATTKENETPLKEIYSSEALSHFGIKLVGLNINQVFLLEVV